MLIVLSLNRVNVIYSASPHVLITAVLDKTNEVVRWPVVYNVERLKLKSNILLTRSMD